MQLLRSKCSCSDQLRSIPHLPRDLLHKSNEKQTLGVVLNKIPLFTNIPSGPGPTLNYQTKEGSQNMCCISSLTPVHLL